MDQDIQQKKRIAPKQSSDEDYVPQNEATRTLVETPNGKWTEQENELYIKFLQSHLEKLQNGQMRRSTKIFMHMSLKIKTRTADQCRGHHRKLLKVCGSVEAIIVHLQARKTAPQEKVHGVPIFLGCKCKALVWQIPIDLDLINGEW